MIIIITRLVIMVISKFSSISITFQTTILTGNRYQINMMTKMMIMIMVIIKVEMTIMMTMWG